MAAQEWVSDARASFTRGSHCVTLSTRVCRLCVVGVADTHPALAPERGIEHVDFNIGSQGNRNELNVSGKRKRVRRLHRAA
eukprot:COSAG02_NODE_2022_length_10084_cov_2.725643_11_plen_81_part_00